MPMNPLGELANRIWQRLDILLEDFDQQDQERQAFLHDSESFFQHRLSIYEERRKEKEKQLESLFDEAFRLCDELHLPRSSIKNDQQIPLKEKEKYLHEQIQHLKTLIYERDKELIQLREMIQIKCRLLGTVTIQTDEIKSVQDGQQVVVSLNNQLNEVRNQLQKLYQQMAALDDDMAKRHLSIVDSFRSINDENQLSWLTTHHPLTGQSLLIRLQTEYDQLYRTMLDEVVRLRREMDQKEPPPPHDLKQELNDLQLRQRYLALLKGFPHKLSARSTLDEIRQSYDHLTASLRAQAREKLKRLWDQLDVPADQRKIPQTKNNEDDYLAINDEVTRLELYVESIRPILTKIQKREWYKKEMVEFEKRAGDPARLRGSSTQLLKEERFRKDLSKEFPKLTDDLRRMVAEWEEGTGKKVIYGGEPYLETMNKEKLSVDFELLHLRLLTKCQILVQQPAALETVSSASSVQSSPPPSPALLTPTRSPRTSSVSRIPTMSFTNSNRKIHKQT